MNYVIKISITIQLSLNNQWAARLLQNVNKHQE